MEINNIDNLDDEESLFNQIKNDIRNGFGDALRCWERIRERYIYRGRQYSPQELIDWFMNAPFAEVKAIGDELGIGWKTICRDVQLMDNVLARGENQGRFLEIAEPFGSDRSTSRLLFDFSILVSCIKETDNSRILDLAGGTGWVAEYLNRYGFNVYTFDIEPLTVYRVERRIRADSRVDGSRLHSAVCDAHKLDIYDDEYFGNIVCFDSLHHMRDFDAVFMEMFRVLKPGGRASFVEPGANHADSRETKEFIRKYKANDTDWIEKSVVLEEVDRIACGTGFNKMRIKPFLLPSAVDYSFDDWQRLAENPEQQTDYFSNLVSFNSNERVIFYMDKPYRI